MSANIAPFVKLVPKISSGRPKNSPKKTSLNKRNILKIRIFQILTEIDEKGIFRFISGSGNYGITFCG
jgi:hypothetical protein